MRTPKTLATLIAIVLCGSPALAEWPIEPLENIPVVVKEGNQWDVQIVADGTGGTIMAWTDAREPEFQIYAQRLDTHGVPLWRENGVRVSDFASLQQYSFILPGPPGETFVLWRDKTEDQFDVYAQRLDQEGYGQWGTRGINVCTAHGDQYAPSAAADGFGGFIVAWKEKRGGPESDIYCQRVDSSGDLLWNPGGVLLCGLTGNQIAPEVVADGTGGAIIVWFDYDGPPRRVRAQRVDAVGATLWPAHGIELSTFPMEQYYPQIATDNAGGAIVVWEEAEDLYGEDAYAHAQRVSPSGELLWGEGVLPGSGTVRLHDPTLIEDGAGGAYVAWTDDYDGIAVQRLDTDGNLLWGDSGITVCNAAGYQTLPTLAADGWGGLCLTWEDTRQSGPAVYAQRVDPAGQIRWEPNGVVISPPTHYFYHPLVNDGRGGLVIAMDDERNGNQDIFAQRIAGTGHLGDPAPLVTAVQDFPNDQGGQVTVTWLPSYLDAMPWCAVEAYSVWMRQAGGSAPRALRDPAPLAQQLGLTTEHVEDLLRTGWTFAVQVPAALLPEYACITPTYGDSTAAGIPWTEYKVFGHGTEPWMVWESHPDSGYSVDNLAPGVPRGLRFGGSDLLVWDAASEPDFAYHSVYGSEDAVFDPTAILIGYTVEPTYDVSGTSFGYCHVTTSDHTQNESSAASIERPGSAVSQDYPPPIRFAFRAPQPNPFRSRASLEFDLPTAENVELVIYDAAGRQVRVLVCGLFGAGQHRITWDGENEAGQSLAPGVYFARICAGRTEQQSQRLVRIQ